jgi:hypothetical protein
VKRPLSFRQNAFYSLNPFASAPRTSIVDISRHISEPNRSSLSPQTYRLTLSRYEPLGGS